MVEFVTVTAKEIKFGSNKFLEVARKRARTPEGETEIITVGKGFVAFNGQKRFKNSLGFPAQKSLVEDLARALQSV
jgi:hypothetical protein